MTGNSSLGPQPRVVRVFVSSTFRDMQGERYEIVKRIFPQVRKLCEQRGVARTEVDLRWEFPTSKVRKGRRYRSAWRRFKTAGPISSDCWGNVMVGCRMRSRPS
jgi:hypothetical protein